MKKIQITFDVTIDIEADPLDVIEYLQFNIDHPDIILVEMGEFTEEGFIPLPNLLNMRPINKLSC